MWLSGWAIISLVVTVVMILTYPGTTVTAQFSSLSPTLRVAGCQLPTTFAGSIALDDLGSEPLLRVQLPSGVCSAAPVTVFIPSSTVTVSIRG